MNTQHTPGPWHIVNNNSAIHDRVTKFDKDGARIGDTPMGIATIEIQCTDERKVANARLIAAAPELLDALINIVNNLDSGAFQITVMDDGEPHPGNLDGIRELIKKATGAQ